MKRFLAVVVLLGALAGCGNDPVAPVAAGVASNLGIPATAFHQEFEAVLAGIDRHYGLKELKGVDVADLRARFGPEIEEARDAGAFYATLVRVFAALHNSHSGLVLPARAFAFAGIGTILIGDRLVLTGEIADTTLRDHGLERGWQIAAIDGIPLTQWLSARAELVSASTLQYQRIAAAQQVTWRFWFEPAARQLTFRSPGGTDLTLEVRLDRASSGIDPLPLVTGQAFGESGYIAVNGLTGNVVSEFERFLGGRIDRPALILDLRRNQGGDSSLGHPIMAHLIRQPTPVILPSQTLQPSATLRFTGDLAVLVGPITHSAAESLAHNLKDSRRGTFIGTETAGSSGNGPETFSTPGGVVFRVATRPGQDRSVSGAATEGQGLAPHVIQEQTYEDYLAGRDTVLEFAIRFRGER